MNSLKVALRSLIRRPTFTVTAVSTLAVGIGATTAIFSAVNATILRPLPYTQPEDLYALTSRFVDGRWATGLVAEAYVTATASAPSVMGAVGVSDDQWVLLGDDGRNRQVLVANVDPGFFELFGLPMQAGRTLLPEDYDPGPGMTYAVISDRLWTQMFGRDPAVVGSGVPNLVGIPVTVVGIAPPEFDAPDGTDVWLAGSTNPEARAHNREAYVRVMPGTSRERLEEELDAVMLGVIERLPETATGRDLVAMSLSQVLIGNLGTMLLLLLAGSGLLLLLSCANAATLMLARGVARTKELAVSSAQGATRSQIATQFVAEAFLLSALGSLLGISLAAIGLRVLRVLWGTDLLGTREVPFDFKVFAFAAASLAASTVAVGLFPALRLSEPNVRGLLSQSGGASAGTRIRRTLSGLVMFEIALGVALLSGAGWFATSYVTLAETDPGFAVEGRLIFDAVLDGSTYAPPPQIIMSPEGFAMIDPEWIPSGTPQLWRERLTERLVATGQVTAVGSAQTIPFGEEGDTGFYVATSEQNHDPERQEPVQERRVSLGFFEAMGIRLLAGRTFEPADEGLVAAVVNEEFVRRFLDGRDPVGSSFFRGALTPNFERPIQIVGVVSDARYGSLSDPVVPLYYVRDEPYDQSLVVATTSEDPLALAPEIVRAAAELDPSIPIEVRSLEAILDDELVLHRAGLVLMTVFAALALVLVTIGIYGAVAHSTGKRARELATRMAFGADPQAVARLVISEGGVVALSGIALGLGVAYVAGRVVASQVYGVEPGDPFVLVGSAAAVLVVVFLAYLVPALRATRLRPVAALKVE